MPLTGTLNPGWREVRCLKTNNEKGCAVPEILCIAMQILLAVAGILNNYMIWMVQVIIFHGMPGGTATHGKRGTAQA